MDLLCATCVRVVSLVCMLAGDGRHFRDKVNMVAKGAVSFRSPYALKRYNDSEYACGRPQAWCDYETARMNDFASAKLKLCDKIGERAVWPSGRRKVHVESHQ